MKLYKFNDLNLIDKYNLLLTIKYILTDSRKLILDLDYHKIYHKNVYVTFDIDVNINMTLNIKDVYILTDNNIKYIDFKSMRFKTTSEINNIINKCERILKINNILNNG